MVVGENLSFVILALEARIHKLLTLMENVDPRLKAEDDGEEGSDIIATWCARDPQTHVAEYTDEESFEPRPPL